MTFQEFKELLIWSERIKADTPEAELLNRILSDKLNRMVERELYTKSKTAPTQEEREAARQEYLDRAGIHPDFRW